MNAESVRLEGKPLEEVDAFTNLGSVADNKRARGLTI